VEVLLVHMYANAGLDLHHLVPFATVPENNSRSMVRQTELLVHRMVRIILVIRTSHVLALPRPRETVPFFAHSTQVALSLSSDHSLFGNDKLYIQISLETLFN
jgi:branched-subunit amino acid transport protein AzlD